MTKYSLPLMPVGTPLYNFNTPFPFAGGLDSVGPPLHLWTGAMVQQEGDEIHLGKYSPEMHDRGKLERHSPRELHGAGRISSKDKCGHSIRLRLIDATEESD